MTHIIAALVAFATLISTIYIFLKGTAFIVAGVAALLLASGSIYTGYQSDRANRLKAALSLLLTDVLKLRDIDAESISLIKEMARRPGTRNDLTGVLEEILRVSIDPAQRYWVYVALGNIGGKRAKRILRKGLQDEHELARRGAESAWELIEAGKGNGFYKSQ